MHGHLERSKRQEILQKKGHEKKNPNTYWKTEDSGIQNPKKVTQFSNTCTHNLSVYVVSATYICMPIPDSPRSPARPCSPQPPRIYSPIFTNKWIQPSHTMDVIIKNKRK